MKKIFLCTVFLTAISQVLSPNCCCLEVTRPDTVWRNFVEQGTIFPGIPEGDIELTVLNGSNTGTGFRGLVNNVRQKRELTLGVTGLNEGHVNNNSKLQGFLFRFCTEDPEAPEENAVFSRFVLRSKTPTRLVFERFICREPVPELLDSEWISYDYTGVSQRVASFSKFCCVSFVPCVLTAILSQIPGTPDPYSLWTNSLWTNSSWLSLYTFSLSASLSALPLMTYYFCDCEGFCGGIFDDCCCCCCMGSLDPCDEICGDSSLGCVVKMDGFPTACAYCLFGPHLLIKYC